MGMARFYSGYLFYTAGLLGLFLLLFLAACATPSLQLQCHAMQTRMRATDMSEDQRRFAEMEWEACQEELRQAEKNDSLRWEKVHDDFAPGE